MGRQKRTKHKGGINEAGKVSMASSDAFLLASRVVMTALIFVVLDELYSKVNYPI